MALVYIAIVVVGMLAGRANLVGMQNGLTGNKLLIAAVGAVVAVFLFSLVVWGFAALDWYWPLIALAAGAVICVVAINSTNFPFWYGALPFLYTATAIGGIYLWFWNWPF
jgi:hypothetical protein